MASLIMMALYNIIDTFWVARLGHQAIAALTIILPFHIFVIGFGVGTGVGISALTSRRFGEGNVEAANHAAGQIFFLSGFLGGIILVASVLFPNTILIALGATPDILDYGRQYLVILALGIPGFFLAIMINNLLRGSGDTLRPMMFMVSGSVLNIILDPLLIFGAAPFPEMGVRGAALATVISQMLSAALAFSYLVLLRQSSYRISWRHLRPVWPVLRDIYRVGFPTMIINVGESVSFALFNNVLSPFGSVSIAAAGIGFRIADLAWMPIWGVSQGLLPVVGFNFGARNWHRLWGAVRIATIGLALFSALSLLVLELLSPQIIGIFSPTPEMIQIAVPAMRIMLSGIVIFAPTMLFVAAFQGLSRGTDALLLSLIRQFVIFVPLLYLLSATLGLTGIWLSMPATDVVAFVVSGLWLFREYQRQKRAGGWVDIPGSG